MYGEVSELRHMASLHFKLFFPLREMPSGKGWGQKMNILFIPNLVSAMPVIQVCHNDVMELWYSFSKLAKSSTVITIILAETMQETSRPGFAKMQMWKRLWELKISTQLNLIMSLLEIYFNEKRKSRVITVAFRIPHSAMPGSIAVGDRMSPQLFVTKQEIKGMFSLSAHNIYSYYFCSLLCTNVNYINYMDRKSQSHDVKYSSDTGSGFRFITSFLL